MPQSLPRLGRLPRLRPRLAVAAGSLFLAQRLLRSWASHRNVLASRSLKAWRKRRHTAIQQPLRNFRRSLIRQEKQYEHTPSKAQRISLVTGIAAALGTPKLEIAIEAASVGGLLHVRYWPKADIGYCTAHVRFRE